MQSPRNPGASGTTETTHSTTDGENSLICNHRGLILLGYCVSDLHQSRWNDQHLNTADLIKRANANRRKRFLDDCAHLRPLPDTMLDTDYIINGIPIRRLAVPLAVLTIIVVALISLMREPGMEPLTTGPVTATNPDPATKPSVKIDPNSFVDALGPAVPNEVQPSSTLPQRLSLFP